METTPELSVRWIKFETWDINDYGPFADEDREINGNRLPLIVVLGFETEIQVWLVEANRRIQPIFKLGFGPVKAFCILQTPPFSVLDDEFNGHRPMVALCDNSGVRGHFHSMKLISLKTANLVHSEELESEIDDIKSSKMIIVAALKDIVVVFNAANMKKMCTLSSYPGPGSYPYRSSYPNPLAIDGGWLAYADKMLYKQRKSRGGVIDVGQTYGALAVDVAKSVAKGIELLKETITSRISEQELPSPTSTDLKSTQPGIVTIVATSLVTSEANFPTSANIVNLKNTRVKGIVAHFRAHINEPVAALAFDSFGVHLITASSSGRNFNVFRIASNSASSTSNIVQHLYVLRRGDTTATVQNISFSLASRYVAVSTLAGTTHIYAVSPYEGEVRTEWLESGNNAFNSASVCLLNDYLPKIIDPSTRIKQPAGFAQTYADSPSLNRYDEQVFGYTKYCVAAEFVPNKADPKRPLLTKEEKEKHRAVSLFIIDCYANLVEYSICFKSADQDMLGSEKTELSLTPYAMTNFLKKQFPSNLRLPLNDENPFMVTQRFVPTAGKDENSDEELYHRQVQSEVNYTWQDFVGVEIASMCPEMETSMETVMLSPSSSAVFPQNSENTSVECSASLSSQSSGPRDEN